MIRMIQSKPLVIVIALATLSITLRLYHLNYQSLWLDELYSVIPTAPNYSFESILEYSKNDQPPLFFIYIHYAFRIFGYNEVVGRTTSVLAGVIGIFTVYLLGKECEEKRVGLFAAFLASISYFHIYYSQELRFYSLSFLLSALSYLFYIRAFKNCRIADFIAYLIFTVCLLYTHYYGLVILSAQVLTFFFLLTYKRDVKFILLSSICGVIFVIAFIPWIPTIISDSKISTFWIKVPEPYFIAEYFYDYTGKDPLTTGLYLIFIFLFARSFFSKASFDFNGKPIYIIIVLWILLSYLLPYLRSISSTPMLHARYTIVTLPAWFILFAIGWNKIKYLNWRSYIPLLLVFTFLVNMLFFKKHYTRIHKSQFREVSELVVKKNNLNEPVYSSLPWHFNFYFRNSNYKAQDLQELSSSYDKRFWLLQAHYPDNEMIFEVNNLKTDFEIIEQYSFYQANAFLMQRKVVK